MAAKAATTGHAHYFIGDPVVCQICGIRQPMTDPAERLPYSHDERHLAVCPCAIAERRATVERIRAALGERMSLRALSGRGYAIDRTEIDAILDAEAGR